MAVLDTVRSLLSNLVITRVPQERIIINDPQGEILGIVEVSSVRGNKVRLRLGFPRNYGIQREEILEPKAPSTNEQNPRFLPTESP